MAYLRSERYSTAFEPGCSIGATTAGLAARDLVAMEPKALHTARATVGDHVGFRLGQVPDDWTDDHFDHFDLVVVYEVDYYLDVEGCQLLAGLVGRSADALVVAHWRYPVSDYPLAATKCSRSSPLRPLTSASTTWSATLSRTSDRHLDPRPPTAGCSHRAGSRARCHVTGEDRASPFPQIAADLGIAEFGLLRWMTLDAIDAEHK